MKTSVTIMIFLGFSFVANITAVSQDVNKKQSADISAIKQLMANIDEVYNKRDAEAYSGYFTEDADFLWATGQLSTGRSEIKQQVTNAFTMVSPEYKHISEMQKIRFLKPDIAIGDGTVAFAREGTPEPVWKAPASCVLKKEKGEWRCASVRLIPSCK
jgi:uncharacterized protein (TIGR02246 family)